MAGSRKVVKSKKGRKMMKGGAEENKIQIYDASNNVTPLLTGTLTTTDGYLFGIGKTSKFYLETDTAKTNGFSVTLSTENKTITFQDSPPPKAGIIANMNYVYSVSTAPAAAVPIVATSQVGGKRKSKKSQKKSKKSKKSKSQKKSKK